MSDVMMNTQVGDLKKLESHFETLKVLIGAELTGQIRGFADSVGGFITGLNNMDPAVFSGLVTGLETIAGLGVDLGVAAGAIKIMGSLGVAGGLGMGAIALAGIAAGIEDYMVTMEQIEQKGYFGDMALDMNSINSYVSTLGSDFETAKGKIEQFNTQLAASATSYQTAATAMSGTLLSKMLTGGTLTQEDKDALFLMGETMHQSLMDGLNSSKNSQIAFWDFLFGSSSDTEGYQGIIETVNTGFDGAMQEA